MKSIQPFGAFVEFMPGKDGLLHISEIKWESLENMEGVLRSWRRSKGEIDRNR
ncbi:MAG: S1 RNA-binding domain-containing protein [Cyclobacteriaceae bacterium]